MARSARLAMNRVPVKEFSGVPPSEGGENRPSRQVPVHCADGSTLALASKRRSKIPSILTRSRWMQKSRCLPGRAISCPAISTTRRTEQPVQVVRHSIHCSGPWKSMRRCIRIIAAKYAFYLAADPFSTPPVIRQFFDWRWESLRVRPIMSISSGLSAVSWRGRIEETEFSVRMTMSSSLHPRLGGRGFSTHEQDFHISLSVSGIGR